MGAKGLVGDMFLCVKCLSPNWQVPEALRVWMHLHVFSILSEHIFHNFDTRQTTNFIRTSCDFQFNHKIILHYTHMTYFYFLF